MNAVTVYALCKKADARLEQMIHDMEGMTISVVEQVPSAAEASYNVMYLVDTNGDGRYEAYIKADVDGTPTMVELGPIIDLSAYYTSAQIDTLLAGKQALLTWDNTPTSGSSNAISSGAIYNALEGVHRELTQAQYDQLTPAEKNNGTIYFITDAEAEGDFSGLEDRVDDLETSNQSAVHYKGTTTTPISNGSTTNPITIDGESYTAIFGDIVVYGYTEFVFDGSAWSEFGRPFDTTPTSGSANAVTSDGIYKATPMARGGTGTSAVGSSASVGNSGYSFAFGSNASATANFSTAIGNGANSSQAYCIAIGRGVVASKSSQSAFGKFNSPKSNTIFEVGCGSDNNHRANILEATATSVNVNGDIQKNGVSLPTPYTTMPTITAKMLGQIAQYVGTTDANYKKGWFYEAVSDGEETPTYSWEAISFNSGGGGDETETNIIPLATPNVVIVDSDYNSNAYKNDYNGITFVKSYDYGAQPSCYIDVSSLVSSDILCSSNTKIKIHAFLTSNWDGALSNTLQMYIGDGAPTSDDWVTVVTHAVSESSPYGYYDTIDVSDINVSGTSNGRIYFRMIHGSETTSYNTWIQIASLDIIHTATPEEPSITFKGGIIDELYTYEVIE